MRWTISLCFFVSVWAPLAAQADPEDVTANRSNVDHLGSAKLSIGTTGGFGWVTQGGADAKNEFASSVSKIGQSFGLLVSFAPHERFVPRLELLYMAKGADIENPEGMEAGTFDATYLGGALLLDVNLLTSSSIRPYILGGMELGYLLDAKISSYTTGNITDVTDGTTMLDVGIIGGAGVGCLFASRHEITFETRVNIGLRTTDGTEGSDYEFLNRSLMFMLGYRLGVLSGGSRSQKLTDSDNDGIPDSRDKCVEEAEDDDGFQDDDGCPDTDNDGDKVPDAKDQCPDKAEDINGFEDEDGCPDPDKDNDGDGVGDSKDSCQGQGEDKNGFKDDDGCPDGDEDSDQDLVKDFADKCLDKAGPWAADGCPREYQHIAVEKERIVFKQDARIVFVNSGEGRKAVRDKLSDESLTVLDEIAKALDEHPGIKLRINAHTDDKGSSRKNLELSQKQAEMVRDALVERGAAAERLETKGHGKAKTLGRDQEKNRRIEFEIVQAVNE